MTRYGAFAQLEISWSDKLTIIPGVRVDWTDLKPGATMVGGTMLTRHVKDDGVSPKIAAMYSLTEWLGVFGSVSRTVRMPNIDETFTRSATRPNNPDLRPETSDNVEGGVTLSFDGLATRRDKFRLKTTVFRNDVKDLILNAAGAAGTPYFTNVGRSRFKGVEVEAEYGIGRFFARGNASFIDGQDRNTGLYLNTIPANEYRLTLGYADALSGLSGGWVGEFAERQDEVNRGAFASAGSGLPTPGYDIHSLFFAFKPQGGSAEGFEFRIAADNIFDEQFRRHLSSLDAEGRSFKFTVAKTF
jgi:hemoglobin/transferrin/lactoferrin receptor protein